MKTFIVIFYTIIIILLYHIIILLYHPAYLISVQTAEPTGFAIDKKDLIRRDIIYWHENYYPYIEEEKDIKEIEFLMAEKSHERGLSLRETSYLWDITVKIKFQKGVWDCDGLVKLKYYNINGKWYLIRIENISIRSIWEKK